MKYCSIIALERLVVIYCDYGDVYFQVLCLWQTQVQTQTVHNSSSVQKRQTG